MVPQRRADERSSDFATQIIEQDIATHTARVRRTTSSTAHMTDTKCHLLSIPQELRDMIYNFALTGASPIVIWSNTRTKEDRKGKVPGAALLRTCKQIYNEANGIIYNNNQFLLRFDFSQEFDTMRPPKDYYLQRNVLKLSSALSFVTDGVRALKPTQKVHAPTHRIRNLEMVLLGPPTTRGWALHSGRHDLRALLRTALVLCLQKATSLQVFSIWVTGWNRPDSQRFLKKMVADPDLIQFDCTGAVVWNQDVRDGAKLWIDDETKAGLKRWMYRDDDTKEVTYRVV